jgi:hypothetical protein
LKPCSVPPAPIPPVNPSDSIEWQGQSPRKRMRDRRK